MDYRAIYAATLLAGVIFQTQSIAQVALSTETRARNATNVVTTSVIGNEARKTWHASVENTPAPGNGCFHMRYPDVAWEKVECKEAEARDRTLSTGAADAGNGVDYVAQAHGPITFAAGQFTQFGVTSETGLAECPGCTALGPLEDEYSLQINTNSLNYNVPACLDKPNCFAWQQFVYATDYFYRGKAAMYIQYWLYNYGTCPPPPWKTEAKTGGCYRNSVHQLIGNIAATQLGNVTFWATANAGSDSVNLEYFWGEGIDVYKITADDSYNAETTLGGVDIAPIWNQVEFNVFGEGNYAQANFNNGAAFDVRLSLKDGTQSAPTCIPPQTSAGTTGETNNMRLGSSCQNGTGDEVYVYPPNLGDESICGNVNACVGTNITASFIKFSEANTIPARTIIGGPINSIGALP